MKDSIIENPEVTITQIPIPKEVEEMIRQLGMVVETYKHLIEILARPPSFIVKKVNEKDTS